MDDRRVLLVTGGSRGIGAATALAAGREGWRVLVNYVSNETAAASVANSILDAGGDASIVKGDTGSEEGIAAIFAALDAHYGRIDGLVNNAGVVDMAERVENFSRERLDRMFDINVIGKIRCAAEAVKRMSTERGGRGGSIVNLSSMAAILGSAGQYVDYAASKGAIDTFTIGLAREVAREGIRVNGVRPGVIETDIHASGGIPDRAQAMASAIPVGRPGTAEEVADAILYLLSDRATYVTGTIMNVSGGR